MGRATQYKTRILPLLSRKQQLTVAALISCTTIQEAARKVGVSDQTIYNWLDDEQFKMAYDGARNKLLEQRMKAVEDALDESLVVLREKLHCGNDAIELAAAKAIFEIVLKTRAVKAALENPTGAQVNINLIESVERGRQRVIETRALLGPATVTES